MRCRIICGIMQIVMMASSIPEHIHCPVTRRCLREGTRVEELHRLSNHLKKPDSNTQHVAHHVMRVPFLSLQRKKKKESIRVVGLIVSPRNLCPPGSLDYGLIWKWGLGRCSKLTWGHVGLGWALTLGLRSLKEEEAETQTDTRENTCEDRGRGRSHATSDKGMTTATARSWKKGGRIPAQGLWREHSPVCTLISDPWLPELWEKNLLLSHTAQVLVI